MMSSERSIKHKETETFRRIEAILKHGYLPDIHSKVRSTGEMLSFEAPLRFKSPIISVSPDGEVWVAYRGNHQKDEIIPNGGEADSNNFDLLLNRLPRGHRPESYLTHPAFIMPIGIVLSVIAILKIFDWLN
ncbi:MAG: hypothetical protein AAFW68_08925 [Pseudomonadota bacterium]